MKKLLAVALCVFLMCGMCVPAYAAIEVGSTITAGSSGMSNILFEDALFGDSYRGFCMDADNAPSTTGDIFTVAKTEGNALNNASREDISNCLKTLFVEYFEEFFMNTATGVAYKSGDYYVTYSASRGLLQDIIWNLTDDRKVSDQNIQDKIDAIVADVEAKAAQNYIPDSGYRKAYTFAEYEYGPNGNYLGIVTRERVLEFDFKVFLTTQELVNTYDGPKPQQDFFGYMIYSTNEEPTPTTAPTTTATTAPTTTATTAPTTTATTAPTTTATTAPTATPAPTAADPGSSGGEGTGGNLRPTATPEPTAEPTVPGPTPTATKAPELPATGDEANLVLWFAMLAVAAVGMTVMVMHPAKKFR